MSKIHNESPNFNFYEFMEWAKKQMRDSPVGIRPLEPPVSRQEEHAGEGSYPTSGSVVAERVEAPKSPEPMSDREMLRRIHESDAFTFENVCKSFGVTDEDPKRQD